MIQQNLLPPILPDMPRKILIIRTFPTHIGAEPEAVGSLGGTFDVSATGAATYSIPIKIPQGVGGYATYACYRL